jgi:hypothetical protein
LPLSGSIRINSTAFEAKAARPFIDVFHTSLNGAAWCSYQHDGDARTGLLLRRRRRLHSNDHPPSHLYGHPPDRPHLRPLIGSMMVQSDGRGASSARYIFSLILSRAAFRS